MLIHSFHASSIQLGLQAKVTERVLDFQGFELDISQNGGEEVVALTGRRTGR